MVLVETTVLKDVRIICVARSADLARRVRALFQEHDVTVDFEPSLDKVLERFENAHYDILIVTSSALGPDKSQQLELIEVVAARSPGTQMLFLAERGDLKMAFSSLSAGTYQYASLPVGDEELRLLVQSAVKNRPPNLVPLSAPGEVRLENLVGRSQAMQGVYRQLRQAAATDVPILLVGETGTGKDLAGEAIHQQSRRSEHPFVPVHLGAMPPELISGELFGYEKGAFTGAYERHAGTFEQAGAGTVFLDEIGTLDVKTQVALLRVIEHHKYQRFGGRRNLSMKSRIVAATNENLQEAVKRGRFREDLYYRLDVFTITMPPLRERAGDIPLLIDHFLKRFSRAFQKNVVGIAPENVARLEAYPWPGNVRELKNVIQRAVLVSSGDVILPQHLPPRFRSDNRTRNKVAFEVGASLEEVEREMIVQTLAHCDNNRTKTAETLGISRRALYNKLRRYQL